MREVYRDTGFLTGTHHGTDGSATLLDPARDFVVLYAIGRLLANTTQETSGLVTAQTETTLTATGVTWNNGDEYTLYVGATANAVISSTEVCRRSGFAAPFWKLQNGILPEFEDDDQQKMTIRRARPTKLRR